MRNEALIKERKENLIKAAKNDCPKYVPVMANPAMGVVGYAGTTVTDCMYDSEKLTDAFTAVFKDLRCDCSIGFGLAITQKARDALGGGQFMLGPDKITLNHLQDSPMEEDEYPLLIENVDGFVENVLVRRKYPFIFTDDIEKVKNALKITMKDMSYAYIDTYKNVEERLLDDYSVISLGADCQYMAPPIDVIFDHLRGFTGTVKDIRRRPQLVHEAMRVLWEKRCRHFDDVVTDPPFVCQHAHIPAYLNPKQYDEFYWPYEKQLIENVYNRGYQSEILLEGRWMHILDCFKDIPKNSAILHVDDDDVAEVSRAVGDYQTIAGGAEVNNLMLGSEKVCIDRTKRALDECAGRGGFIFTTDKSWVCPADINDNLFKVYEYAWENGKY